MEPLLTPETLQHLQVPPTRQEHVSDHHQRNTPQPVCLSLVRLTLQGHCSNSNTVADWSDAASPSPESPGHTATPASSQTELWLSDPSSERPLSVAGQRYRWSERERETGSQREGQVVRERETGGQRRRQVVRERETGRTLTAKAKTQRRQNQGLRLMLPSTGGT